MTHPLDIDDPFCIIYDCGRVDYIVDRYKTKLVAKINRKQLQKYYDKRLKIKLVTEVRKIYPDYTSDMVISKIY